MSQILSGIRHTLDGEWVPALDTYFAFDLPDCPLDYDRRRATLARLLGVAATSDSILHVNAISLALPTTDAHLRLVASYSAGHFPQIYDGLKGLGAEGVILKRRHAHYAKQLSCGVECRDWLKRRFEWIGYPVISAQMHQSPGQLDAVPPLHLTAVDSRHRPHDTPC